MKEELLSLPDSILYSVERPARYLGAETNCVYKNAESMAVRLALGFPDTYEIGMSHLGLQMLYHLANTDQETWAERVFLPYPDMISALRKNALCLGTLESQTPLHKFDVLGLSLQYELCLSSVLAMLDLGGINLLAEDRKGNEPLVIGGGPLALHPEPLADFFDVFYLGDAEEFIGELLILVKKAKCIRPDSWRQHALEDLGKIPGVYTPHFKQNYPITKRTLPKLNPEFLPSKPLVPAISIVHDRLNLELMRGCIRGCRFCQAGYIYRPQRERAPADMLDALKVSTQNSGYDEASLLSLSSADYASLSSLIDNMLNEESCSKLSVSIPSTRVDALTDELLEQLDRVKKAGLTLAPEGGSQRLRDVINKGLSDDEIVDTCALAFCRGHQTIKLYFMLGLPTETDEDLLAIISLCERILALGEAKGKNLTVSVSTFIPKPHTPFQWAGQVNIEETKRKQTLLRQALARGSRNLRRLRLQTHDPRASFLEGVFARGGRELGKVINAAYCKGAILDGWTEYFRFDLWEQSFIELGIDAASYLEERALTETLPWDHIDCGVDKAYFLSEWQRALRGEPTKNCLSSSCSRCGVCSPGELRNVKFPVLSDAGHEAAKKEVGSLQEKNEVSSLRSGAARRVRFSFSKYGAFRFVGHLDLIKVMHRAFRRADISVQYSAGFNPQPRLSLGPPLQLGASSREEFGNLQILSDIKMDEFIRRLGHVLPTGLSPITAVEISKKDAALDQSISAFRFLAEAKKADHPKVSTLLDEELSLLKVMRKKSRGDEALVLLSEFVSHYHFYHTETEHCLEFTLRFNPVTGSLRPAQVVTAIWGLKLGEFSLQKVKTFFKSDVVSGVCGAAPRPLS